MGCGKCKIRCSFVFKAHLKLFHHIKTPIVYCSATVKYVRSQNTHVLFMKYHSAIDIVQFVGKIWGWESIFLEVVNNFAIKKLLDVDISDSAFIPDIKLAKRAGYA